MTIDVGWCVNNIESNFLELQKLGCKTFADAVMECISRNGSCQNPNATGFCEKQVGALTNCIGTADAGNPFQ